MTEVAVRRAMTSPGDPPVKTRMPLESSSCLTGAGRRGDRKAMSCSDRSAGSTTSTYSNCLLEGNEGEPSAAGGVVRCIVVPCLRADTSRPRSIETKWTPFRVRRLPAEPQRKRQGGLLCGDDGTQPGAAVQEP